MKDTLRKIQPQHALFLIAAFGLFASFGIEFAPNLATAAPKEEGKAQELFEEAEALFSGHNLEEAEKAYRAALEKDPATQWAHHQLGRIAFSENELEEALEEFDREIELHPDSASAFYMRGLTHAFLEDYGRAEEDFRSFLEFRPEDEAGLNDLAYVLFLQSKFGEAQETLQALRERNPESFLAQQGLAAVSIELEEPERAEEYAKEALEYAEAMDEELFRQYYPSLNPSQTEKGIATIRKGIRHNLNLVSSLQGGEFAPDKDTPEILKPYFGTAPESKYGAVFLAASCSASHGGSTCSISASASDTSPLTGSSVTITGTAASGSLHDHTWIDIYRDGDDPSTDVVDFCFNSSPCTFTTQAYSTAQSHTYKAKIVTLSPYTVHTTSNTVTVTWSEPCTRSAPSVSLTPSLQSGDPGQPLQYTATITNNDTSGCGSTTFNFAGNHFNSNISSTTVSPTSASISPGGSAQTTLSAASSSAASPGDYNVYVDVTSSIHALAFGSAIYRVNPTLSASLSADPTSGDTDTNFTMTVSVGGTASGDISLQLFCDGVNPDTVQFTTTTNPYTFGTKCNYDSSGTKFPKVEVAREGLTASPTTSISVSPTLSASLSADPTSGDTDTNFTMTASVGGTATGSMTITLFCDGVNPSASTTTTTNPYTFATKCSYSSSGTKAPKIDVSRDGLDTSASTSISVSPTLSASLSADPTSGDTDTNFTMTVSVGGSATGDITLQLFCDGVNSDTAQFPTTTNPYTFATKCNYDTGGTKTPKVEVSREGLSASPTTSIDVDATLTASLSADPTSGDTDTNFTMTVSVGGSATGDISLQLFCDGVNSDTVQFTTTTNPYTFGTKCNYDTGGTKTPKVEVGREGLTATATTSISVTALPDLIVESVTPTPSSPQIGETVNYAVVVKNQGSVSSDGGWLGAYLPANLPNDDCSGGGSAFDVEQLGTIAAGSTKSFTMTLSGGFDSSGSQTVWMFADDLCSVTELQEGNNKKSRTVTVQSDTTAPTVTITASPTSVTTTWQNEDATAEIGCDDGTGSGCESATSWKFMTPTTDPGTCPTTLASYTGAYNGTGITINDHRWVCATAEDLAGNRGYTSTPVEFKVDKIKPESDITSPATGTWQTGSFTVNVSDTDEGGSGFFASGARYHVFEGPPGSRTQTVNDGERTLSSGKTIPVGGSVTDGCSVQGEFTCQVQVFARDQAGNEGDPGTEGDFITVHIDYTLPTVGLISPTNATTNVEQTYSTAVSDDESGLDFCNFVVDGIIKGTMTISSGTASFPHAFTAPGSYNVHASCQDAAGNYRIGTDVTVTVGDPEPGFPSDRWQRLWYTVSGESPTFDAANFLGETPDETSLRFETDWGTDPLAYGIAERIGFESSRSLTVGTTGTYRFYIGSDDGARLFVNGSTLASQWSDNSFRTTSGDVTLGVGSHNFQLDYYENTNDAKVFFTPAVDIGVQPAVIHDGGTVTITVTCLDACEGKAAEVRISGAYPNIEATPGCTISGDSCSYDYQLPFMGFTSNRTASFTALVDVNGDGTKGNSTGEVSPVENVTVTNCTKSKSPPERTFPVPVSTATSTKSCDILISHVGFDASDSSAVSYEVTGTDPNIQAPFGSIIEMDDQPPESGDCELDLKWRTEWEEPPSGSSFNFWTYSEVGDYNAATGLKEGSGYDADNDLRWGYQLLVPAPDRVCRLKESFLGISTPGEEDYIRPEPDPLTFELTDPGYTDVSFFVDALYSNDEADGRVENTWGTNHEFVECLEHAHCDPDSLDPNVDAVSTKAQCNLGSTTNFPQNACIDSIPPTATVESEVFFATAEGGAVGFKSATASYWLKAGQYTIDVTDSDSGANASGIDTANCTYSVWNSISGTVRTNVQRTCSGSITIDVGSDFDGDGIIDCGSSSAGLSGCRVTAYNLDLAGNSSEAFDRSLNIDLIPPTITQNE